jgi:hypothetical protein
LGVRRAATRMAGESAARGRTAPSQLAAVRVFARRTAVVGDASTWAAPRLPLVAAHRIARRMEAASAVKRRTASNLSMWRGTCTASHVSRPRRPTTSSRPHHNSPATSLVSAYPDGLTAQQIGILIPACVSGYQQIQPAHTAEACAGAMTDNPERPVRIGPPPPKLRGSPGAARVAISVRCSRGPRHLHPPDEVGRNNGRRDTRGCEGIYEDTVHRLGGWYSVGRFCAEDMCNTMFGRAFTQNGEIGAASRCRGKDMLYGGYRVLQEVEAAPQELLWSKEAYKCLWTLQRSRCWDTGQGLAKRIALGHALETLSYSDPTSVLCNLTILLG